MGIEEEVAVSEITILPDGRVYVFGMSDSVLEVLQTFEPRDPRLGALTNQVRGLSKKYPRGSEQSTSRSASGGID
jgi:hypothetical protein